MSDFPKLDATDRALIVATQGGLPLVARPYQAIGEQVGIAGEEVVRRLQSMLESGVIRRIGAVPNHYAIGWTANGMTVWDVADDRVDELAPALAPWTSSPIATGDHAAGRYPWGRRVARLALQPLCDGSWRIPSRGRGQGRNNCDVAGGGVPCQRNSVLDPDTEEIGVAYLNSPTRASA